VHHVLFLIFFLDWSWSSALGASLGSASTVRANITSRVIGGQGAVIIHEEIIFSAAFPS
jgi:hypothetical protein